MVTKGEMQLGERNQKPRLNTHTHTHTAIYRRDNQQGPTVWHRELYSIFCDTPYEKKSESPWIPRTENFWDQTNQSQRKSVLNIHWKDWCWSSNSLATWYQELTHWKRPCCWERLKAGGEGDDRGWDGWMTLPTWWTGVWAGTRNWWWTGKPGVLQSMDHKESDMSEWLNLL